MSVILISYANKAFYRSQQDLKKSAYLHGVDKVIDYNDIWIKRQTEFLKKNKHILFQKRGNGNWLWKPYIILDALMQMNENDVMLYIDAGSTIINSVIPLVELAMKQEIVVFYNNGHKNKIWTKRDCFYYMDCDTEKYHEANQLLAGYIVLKKTSKTLSLLSEWLQYAEDERVLTDLQNTCGLPDLDGFKDHRHDQSILSLLACKYNIELFRDPSQWGNKYKMPDYRVPGEFVEDGYVDQSFHNSPYPTILNGHRMKLKMNIIDSAKYFLMKFHFGKYE